MAKGSPNYSGEDECNRSLIKRVKTDKETWAFGYDVKLYQLKRPGGSISVKW